MAVLVDIFLHAIDGAPVGFIFHAVDGVFAALAKPGGIFDVGLHPKPVCTFRDAGFTGRAVVIAELFVGLDPQVLFGDAIGGALAVPDDEQVSAGEAFRLDLLRFFQARVPLYVSARLRNLSQFTCRLKSSLCLRSSSMRRAIVPIRRARDRSERWVSPMERR